MHTTVLITPVDYGKCQRGGLERPFWEDGGRRTVNGSQEEVGFTSGNCGLDQDSGSLSGLSP